MHNYYLRAGVLPRFPFLRQAPSRLLVLRVFFFEKRGSFAMRVPNDATHDRIVAIRMIPAILRNASVAAFVCICSSTSLHAQGRLVTGRIIDAFSRRPIQGAFVSLGSTRGVTSDATGHFVLPLQFDTAVTISIQRLGYRSEQRRVVPGGPLLDVELAEAAIELNGIVVTGTAGAVQKRSIGNLVTTIDAAAVTQQVGAPDVGALLNGRAPGVIIMPPTGMVGTGPKVRVRGANSFSLNDQPLIYIDGVRVNNETASGPQVQGFGSAAITRLGDIQPAEIETIEIIKGPAAATLYGTEAANGVIQIITKKGTSSGRARIGVTLRQGAIWFADPAGRTPPAFYRDSSGAVRELNLFVT
jgi:TonB-dependent SusC/RagA subfamily outer membrane receptor